MMKRLLSVALSLIAAGLVAMLLFIAKFGAPEWYLNYFFVLSPIVLLLSLVVGGLLYAVLNALRVPLSIPICIAAGALIGALPGVLLWLGYRQPPPSPEEVATYPIIFGAFGAIGGLTFALIVRMLKLR
jgi:hypothetical protein